MSAKKHRRRKHSRNSRWQHKTSIFLISIVLLLMGAVLTVASNSLNKKNEESKSEEAALERDYEEGLEYAEELDETEENRENGEYKKEVAKQKGGLKEPDEIFLKPKK